MHDDGRGGRYFNRRTQPSVMAYVIFQGRQLTDGCIYIYATSVQNIYVGTCRDKEFGGTEQRNAHIDEYTFLLLLPRGWLFYTASGTALAVGTAYVARQAQHLAILIYFLIIGTTAL